MRTVPLVRVVLGEPERDAVAEVLASGRLAQGEQVAAFEEEFSARVGGRACVAVNSGTSALHLALLAAGIGPGDEVLVPSFTFAATANAVVHAGATPVFIDIDPMTFTMSPEHALSSVNARTAAIIPVHLFGQPADMTALNDLAARNNLLVLEDAAQAHGARQHDVPAGALGSIAAFSFYATKNMTTGEGGMVVCLDEQVARSVRLLRNQGMEVRYQNEVAGLNNRMTEMAAAIGRPQLERLAEMNEHRRAVAGRYNRELTGLGLPTVAADNEHVYHQYTVRTPHRDALAAHLSGRGVGTGVFYPTPVHRLPAYLLDQELVETDTACREVLSLPMHPHLSTEDVDHVVESVNAFIEDPR